MPNISKPSLLARTGLEPTGALLTLGFALGLLLVAGCGRQQDASQSAPSSLGGGLGLQGTPGQLTGVLPSTDVSVGDNERFLLVLIGPDNQIVSDATVDMGFFKVTGPGAAELRGRAPGQFRESLVGKGLYVARANFDEPGEWGAVVNVQRPGSEPTQLRLAFKVKEKSSTPATGSPVPPSRTLTGATASDIERFSSARPPDPRLYRVSVSDAITQGKPFAVLFATPGFCTSRLCGPSLEVLQKLADQYGDQMNYVHVEIYKDGRPNERQEIVPYVAEWGLTSEPWLFIVGADGRLVDKFEGTITVEEATPSIKRALGAE